MKELFYTKKDLSTGIKRNVFYFRVVDSSSKRGYNRTIKVYVINKDYSLSLIGEDHVNTASYRGDKPTAIRIIADIFNYKTDGYELLRDDITIHEIY